MTRTGQTSQHPTNCTIHRCTHSQTTNPNPTKSLEDQDFAPDKKKQPIIITWNSPLVASEWNAASSLCARASASRACTCPRTCQTFPWRRASRVPPLRWSEGRRRCVGGRAADQGPRRGWQIWLPMIGFRREQVGSAGEEHVSCGIPGMGRGMLDQSEHKSLIKTLNSLAPAQGGI
jgi:hypothetical protein